VAGCGAGYDAPDYIGGGWVLLFFGAASGKRPVQVSSSADRGSGNGTGGVRAVCRERPGLVEVAEVGAFLPDVAAGPAFGAEVAAVVVYRHGEEGLGHFVPPLLAALASRPLGRVVCR
jgi:hypothetical protein